jgi:hypothetical protein
MPPPTRAGAGPWKRESTRTEPLKFFSEPATDGWEPARVTTIAGGCAAIATDKQFASTMAAAISFIRMSSPQIPAKFVGRNILWKQTRSR